MGILEDLTAERYGAHSSVFERYTESAKRAIYYARAEALSRCDKVITVADILSGLGVEEGSRAERVASLKGSAFYLRWLSGLPQLPAVNAGEDCKNQEHQPTLELDAKVALAYAVMEANRDHEYWIDSDHLLRGLLRFPNKAHFALLKTEISLKVARARSKRDRKEFRPKETPSLKAVRYMVRKHFAFWVPPILGLACYLYVLLQSFSIGMSPLAR
jgi:ATP-dependent Clp protease ATP-binding subunit ClpA